MALLLPMEKGERLSIIVYTRRGGANPSPVYDDLAPSLPSQAARVVDLFRAWDQDGNGTVSRAEFRNALALVGIKAAHGALPHRAP